MNSTDSVLAKPAFDSDAAYWAFELRRLDELLSALLAARSDPARQAQFAALAAGRMGHRSAIRAARTHSVASGVGIAWDALVERACLDEREEMALLIAAAAALDLTIARQVAMLQGDLGLAQPSVPAVALIETLLDGAPQRLAQPTWLSWTRPLRRCGLVEVGGDGPMALRGVQVADFVQQALHGEGEALDGRLRSTARVWRPEVGETPLEIARIAQGLGRQRAAGAWVLAVCGPRHSGKTRRVAALAAELGRPCLTVMGDGLVSRPDAAERLELAVHNAAFVGAVLHLDGCGRLLEQRPEVAARVERLLRELAEGLVVVLELEEGQGVPQGLSGCVGPVLELTEASLEERVGQWARALNSDVEVDGAMDLEVLAREVALSGVRLEVAVRWAQVFAEDGRVGLAGLRAAAAQLRSGAREASGGPGERQTSVVVVPAVCGGEERWLGAPAAYDDGLEAGRGTSARPVRRGWSGRALR